MDEKRAPWAPGEGNAGTFLFRSEDWPPKPSSPTPGWTTYSGPDRPSWKDDGDNGQDNEGQIGSETE